MTFYHGTNKESWDAIQKEGILFGRRISPITGKEISRCTYLATNLEEAKQYGNVVLKVTYNPLYNKGNVKKDKRGIPINNYIKDCWQVRVYEPISLSNLERII